MVFIFNVNCSVAYTYCARITQNRGTSKNEAIVLEFDATVQQKENWVRGHSGGFLQTPAHSTLHSMDIRPFGLPH